MKLWLLISLNLACYGIFMLIARLPIFSWLTASPETATSTAGKLANGFATLFIFLVPVLAFANAVLPERFDYYKLHRKVKVLPAVLAVLAILTSVFFIDVLDKWNTGLITDAELIAGRAASMIYSDWISQMPGITDLLIFLLASAVVPAVVEELFFRGGVMQLLIGALKNVHLAIFLSAFFFSLMHMDVFGFFPRFVLGMALGYLFWWSGSLRLSMIGHFVFNAFSIVSVYIAQQYPESWWAKSETTYTLGAISLVVSLGMLLTCRNLLKRDPQRV